MSTTKPERPNIPIGDLRAFVIESNRIEGIMETTFDQVKAHLDFLGASMIQPDHLIKLVKVLQPEARLRFHTGIPGVRVGSHVAPSSGPKLLRHLMHILNEVNGIGSWGFTPRQLHMEYMNLHPFTDGNGRSGRAIWLWQMVRRPNYAWSLPFLQQWYYEGLASHDRHKAAQ